MVVHRQYGAVAARKVNPDSTHDRFFPHSSDRRTPIDIVNNLRMREWVQLWEQQVEAFILYIQHQAR